MNQQKSTELNELLTALSLAQEDMKVAHKDSDNQFFKSKYANLQAVVESARPSLCKNGLSVTQYVDQNGDGFDYLCTMLGHKSGQYIISRMKLNPVKQDVQSLGSYITYIRRYAYSAIVGVYDGIEDDDGNSATVEYIPSTSIPRVEQREVQQSFSADELVSEKQVKYISFQIGQNKELFRDVLQKYNVQNIQSIKKSDAQNALAYIEAQKQK